MALAQLPYKFCITDPEPNIVGDQLFITFYVKDGNNAILETRTLQFHIDTIEFDIKARIEQAVIEKAVADAGGKMQFFIALKNKNVAVN